MARITSPLTLSEIKKAKPREKTYKLYDGEGLYLSVMPSGKKVWRFDYVDANKKRQTHTIGSFEFVGLNEARQEKFILREKLFRRKSLKHDSENTFNDTFNTWLELWSTGKSESHVSRARNAINNYIVPMIGNINMAEITTRDIVSALEKIDKKGSREILNKTKSALNLCFSYAVAKGICEQNPVMLIDNSVFSRQEKSNFRHLDKHEVCKIHSITNNDGVVISRLCTEFMIRNLTRPNESAGAMWDELNWETGVLTIKNDRMKMKNTHVIPLSNQSIEILNKIKESYNNKTYIFTNEKLNGSIKPSALLDVIQKSNVDSTAHGFRHLASTILNESGLFSSDIIEACLAHKDTNAIRATYNKAQYIEKRRELLQWWSDFIDMCDTEENNLKALKKFNII